MTWKQAENWRPIDSAPKDGSTIELLIPYNREMFTEVECTDKGYWDAEVESTPERRHPRKGCFRFDGDDGAFDIQPTHWRECNE